MKRWRRRCGGGGSAGPHKVGCSALIRFLNPLPSDHLWRRTAYLALLIILRNRSFDQRRRKLYIALRNPHHTMGWTSFWRSIPVFKQMRFNQAGSLKHLVNDSTKIEAISRKNAGAWRCSMFLQKEYCFIMPHHHTAHKVLLIFVHTHTHIPITSYDGRAWLYIDTWVTYCDTSSIQNIK